MAFTTKVRNVSALGDLRVVLDGDPRTVRAGEAVDVTPETAGEAPRWRPATEDDARSLIAGVEQLHARVNGDTVEVYDLGSGLLAQVDNWHPADVDTDAHLEATSLETAGQIIGQTGTENS